MYRVKGSTPMSTTSSGFTDDPECRVQFTLPERRTALIVYHTTNDPGDPVEQHKYRIAINIDGNDVAEVHSGGDMIWLCYGCHGPGYGEGYPLIRAVSFWVGVLDAGSHAVSGRFASFDDGYTTTISSRSLTILLFEGDEYAYIDNSNEVYYEIDDYDFRLFDDSYASVSITPSSDAIALILYGTYNFRGNDSASMMIGIMVDDMVRSMSSYDSRYTYSDPGHNFTASAVSVPRGQHTFKGVFKAMWHFWSRLRINRRLFAVLLLDPSSTVLDVVESGGFAMTYTSSFVLDPFARIARYLPDPAHVFIVGHGGNLICGYRLALIDTPGIAYGVSVDGKVESYSRSTMTYLTATLSAPFIYSGYLDRGLHKIYGVFSSNLTGRRAGVSHRLFNILWFPTGRHPVPVSGIGRDIRRSIYPSADSGMVSSLFDLVGDLYG